MRVLTHYIYYIGLLAIILTACREDELVSYVTDTEISEITSPSGTISGMYVLCEGNMGSNKCTLDYLDLSGEWSADSTRMHYLRNIYGHQNPSTVLELGDVGNDIQIYGSRLWMVINCSNKVEVCHAADARRIGQVNIPNARYVTFHKGFAYVSSYVGGVQTGIEAPLGCVYKVDTLSLQKVDSVLVGYQPEEMAVSQGKLYVANSGGYRAPDFDNTMSVIDLSAPKMLVEKSLEIAPNLHHAVTDRYGHVWVTSRGNYTSTPGRLHCIDVQKNDAVHTFDVSVSAFSLAGDTLFCLCPEDKEGKLVRLIYTRNMQEIGTATTWLKDMPRLTHPYGIIANPESHDFYVMDAKNYVSSGQLLHFASDGSYEWSVRTGDIPSRACFVSHTGGNISTEIEGTEENNPYIAAVDEYVPAPGQFIGKLPEYEDGDDAQTMADKCSKLIADNAGGTVSLGGFGGYITFHFGQSIVNRKDTYDFRIFGNAFKGNSEPGIVMVSVDENHNLLPDDPWYELAGSADTDSIGLVQYNHSVTYEPSRPGFPQWIEEPYTLTGTRLPANAYDKSGKGTNWTLSTLRYGYVDNLPNTDLDGNSFDLDWAVDPVTRKPVTLTHADFVRVYCAMEQVCGWLGETSTEICGAEIIKISNDK